MDSQCINGNKKSLAQYWSNDRYDYFTLPLIQKLRMHAIPHCSGIGNTNLTSVDGRRKTKVSESKLIVIKLGQCKLIM